MRIIFVGFLIAGLIVVGLSTYDFGVTAAPEETASGMVTCEDGTPIPQPSPKPGTK